jgi:hypothetical protein
MKNLLYFFLITLLVLSCSRCKEEDCTDSTNPDCPNYVAPVDPCAGKTEVSADFIIEERIGPGEFREANAVTGCEACVVRVRALNPNLNYTWQIGTDVFTDSVALFGFREEHIGNSYPVTLIVNGPIDSNCHPNDNGMDTITKYISVHHGYDKSLEGNWRIAWDSPPLDSFDVYIEITEGPFFLPILSWHNFDRLGTSDCSPLASSMTASGHNFVRLEATAWPTCRSLSGDFWVRPDGMLEADYRFRDPSNPPLVFTYVRAHGRRIT